MCSEEQMRLMHQYCIIVQQLPKRVIGIKLPKDELLMRRVARGQKARRARSGRGQGEGRR
jgi:hypothetical protein